MNMCGKFSQCSVLQCKSLNLNLQADLSSVYLRLWFKNNSNEHVWEIRTEQCTAVCVDDEKRFLFHVEKCGDKSFPRRKEVGR